MLFLRTCEFCAGLFPIFFSYSTPVIRPTANSGLLRYFSYSQYDVGATIAACAENDHVAMQRTSLVAHQGESVDGVCAVERGRDEAILQGEERPNCVDGSGSGVAVPLHRA